MKRESNIWVNLSILIVISGMLSDSCKKVEVPIDYRDKYVGNLAFKVNRLVEDQVLGLLVYDSIYYYGVINYGAGDNDILIQYTADDNTI
jgi:hypothetical protein